MWCGAQLPEGTPVVISQIATVYYFAHFLIILPLVGWVERPKPLPESISTPVLGGGAAAPKAAE
jgi:ubiquinol-cytochrome c reductase cytochrome b subunit